MSLDQSQKNSFESRLAYFGGAISVNISETMSEYQDLEQFFLDATLMMNYDVRVTQCFINWLIRYGVVLCPTKLMTLLKKIPHEKSVLGAFVSILMENDQRPARWCTLLKRAKKSNYLLFQYLPKPKNPNPYFLKFGITAPLMSANLDHYLLPKNAVLKNCIELKYRSMMVGTVASDVLSFIKKNNLPQTAYKIAKITSHHRAQVYSLIKTMDRLGSYTI